MKDGAKAGGKTPQAEASPAAPPLFAAIPFPPGISSIVAEEAEAIPRFTEREQEVGGWVAEGKRDAEVGHILEMGLETVKTHVSKLLEKAGVETRGAFIAWVWRNRMAAQLRQSLSKKPASYQ